MKNISDAVRIRQARTDLGHFVTLTAAWLNGDMPDTPITREMLQSLVDMAKLRLDALVLVEQMLVTPTLVDIRDKTATDMGSAYAKGPAMTMARDELIL